MTMFGINKIDANDEKLLKEAASRLVEAVRRDNEEAACCRHQQMQQIPEKRHQGQQDQQYEYKRRKH